MYSRRSEFAVCVACTAMLAVLGERGKRRTEEEERSLSTILNTWFCVSCFQNTIFYVLRQPLFTFFCSLIFGLKASDLLPSITRLVRALHPLLDCAPTRLAARQLPRSRSVRIGLNDQRSAVCFPHQRCSGWFGLREFQIVFRVQFCK